MTTPNAGIPEVPEGTLDPAAGLNDALRVIDALLQTAVISINQTAPPGTNADGDLYLVAAEGGTATGAWAGHEDDLAQYVAEGDFWQFYTAGDQVKLLINMADGRLYVFNVADSPASWQVLTGGGLTVLDSDSPQFVGADVLSLRFGGGFTLSEESDGTVVVEGGGGAADLGFFFPGTASSSQLLTKYMAARALQFPANFAGAFGHIGTNPTATWTATVSVNGSQVGTIQVSTGGVFTFATTSGLAIDIDAGDRIDFAAPSSADGTAADVAVTLPVSLV